MPYRVTWDHRGIGGPDLFMPTPLPPHPDRPLDERACPICGEPNECAAAASGSFDTPCWCGAVTITAAQLERVPAEKRGLACICRRCATH
jgi:hypothetical protein